MIDQQLESVTAEDTGGHLVVLAIRSVALGMLIGSAVIALVLWGVRTLQLSSPPESPQLGSAPGVLLVAGTFGGLFMGGAVAFRLMAPIGSLYRRGALAMVSGFGTLVVSLVTIPLDRALGRTGLLFQALACALGCLWLARRARR
ncbi:MAG TPA: hypothetical protein VLT17_09090 [Gemmatimonadales bacterium]|nr:hypothetical protein [Gemmatimonadales bacterium]